MDERELRELFERQAGVVSTRQLLELGADDNLIRRMVRRKDLSRVHRGIYVNHTGPLSWASRAWAAILFHEPAALCGTSATTPAGQTIHVAIEHPRRGGRLPDVRLHGMVDLERKVLWNASPPRLRVEEAVLDLAAEAGSRAEAIAAIADVCQRRRTTPNRIASALALRSRLTHGVWLRTVLNDAAEGALSVLEQLYLRRVERAHGLPPGRRQDAARTVDGVSYRDVRYPGQSLVVELDGRLGHELAQERWDDMDRDLITAITGDTTIRLGWRHADEVPCRTAARLGVLLARRGWDEVPRPCGPTCSLPGEFQALGA